MTRSELDRAYGIADSDIDLSDVDTTIFDGFGLPDFKPILCTVEQVAAVIRWQCQYLFGGFDFAELKSIADLGRRRFILIN